MVTREIQPAEWKRFFAGFSRHFRGRRMTIERVGPDHGPTQTLARRVPLLGITAGPSMHLAEPAESIEVMLGDSPVQNFVHVVMKPTRVRVAQLSDGEDELLIIDSAAGETTRVDFGSQR